jgi:hypothetical protein
MLNPVFNEIIIHCDVCQIVVIGERGHKPPTVAGRFHGACWEFVMCHGMRFFCASEVDWVLMRFFSASLDVLNRHG